MRKTLGAVVAGLSALTLSGCATYTLENTGGGKLRGELAVIWVGEDKFVYVGGANGLQFTPKGGKPIKPDMFYTDGGSIPRPVRAFEGFSPWGYAPAYIIHDWLFYLHDCDPDKLKTLGVGFEDSARILAEVTNVLMERRQVATNEFAFEAISWAVTTPVARKLWDNPSKCGVSEEDRRKVNAALEQASGRSMRSLSRLEPASGAAARPPGQPQVVFRRSY